jgi:hypothetical protein
LEAAAIWRAVSYVLSTTGTWCGILTGCMRAISSGRFRLMSKKNRRPVSVTFSVMGEVPIPNRWG